MLEEKSTEVPSKKDEIFVFILILFIVFPLLSVAIMGGYGFMVWMSQLIFGSPGSH